MTQGTLRNISNEARAQNLVSASERFLRRFNERAGKSNVGAVVRRNSQLRGEMIGQKPERFIATEMIEPMLEVLGYDVRFEPTGYYEIERQFPDFTLVNLDIPNLGEIKIPGKAGRARKQAYGYLRESGDQPLIGISTDGFVWILHVKSRNGEVSYTAHTNLFQYFRRLRVICTYEKEPNHPRLRAMVSDFVSKFNIDAIGELDLS